MLRRIRTEPRIGVAALNPHAGEGGLLGTEQIDVIAPAIERARAAGVLAVGPLPPDTMFVRARKGEFDAIGPRPLESGSIMPVIRYMRLGSVGPITEQ